MAVITILAKRGSIGNLANKRPDFVNCVVGLTRLPLADLLSFSLSGLPAGSSAAISSNKRTPSVILRLSGASTKGKLAMSPRSKACICKITVAKLVRNISGSVNSALLL